MDYRLFQINNGLSGAAVPDASSAGDDALLARLQAPPDLSDGVESLAYWRRRRQRLPWYRLGARREAARMVTVWERRVRAALLRQRGAPIGPRLRGALLIARTQLRRWSRRAGFALTATAAIVLVVAPAAVALDLLLRAF
jgi:hypothetical protein